MTTQRRWSRIQKQILVWAGDEPLRLSYDGDEILIPARDQVARKEPGSPFRFESAQTKTGHYIPGTVLLADVFRNTVGGGYEKIFDVTAMCEYLDRERSELFKRGFAIVSDPEDVTPIMQEQLLPAWEANMDERAREIINAELERRKKLEAKGNPITPGSSEHLVMWAFRHMAKRQAEAKPMISTNDLFAVASGAYNPGAEKPKASYVAPGDPKALFAEAKAMDLKLSKAELEGLMEGDADTLQAVTDKLRARRKELEELAAQP